MEGPGFGNSRAATELQLFGKSAESSADVDGEPEALPMVRTLMGTDEVGNISGARDEPTVDTEIGPVVQSVNEAEAFLEPPPDSLEEGGPSLIARGGILQTLDRPLVKLKDDRSNGLVLMLVPASIGSGLRRGEI